MSGWTPPEVLSVGQKLQCEDFWRSEARSQDGMLAGVLTPHLSLGRPSHRHGEAHTGKSSSTTKSRRPWFESGITRARRRSYRVEKLALNAIDLDAVFQTAYLACGQPGPPSLPPTWGLVTHVLPSLEGQVSTCPFILNSFSRYITLRRGSMTLHASVASAARKDHSINTSPYHLHLHVPETASFQHLVCLTAIRV